MISREILYDTAPSPASELPRAWPRWNEGMAVSCALVHSQVAFAARDVEIDGTTSAQVYDSTLSARCRSEWAAHTAAIDAIINTR